MNNTVVKLKTQLSKAQGELAQLRKDHNSLQSDFYQYQREAVKWSIEDFFHEAEAMEYDITREQAKDALLHMIQKHDCDLGITWETVRCYIEEYGTPKDDKL